MAETAEMWARCYGRQRMHQAKEPKEPSILPPSFTFVSGLLVDSIVYMNSPDVRVTFRLFYIHVLILHEGLFPRTTHIKEMCQHFPEFGNGISSLVGI